MNKKRLYILSSIAAGLLIFFIIWTILVGTGKLTNIDNSVVNNIVSIRGEKGGAFYWVVRLTTEFGFVYVIVTIILALLIVFRFNLKSILIGVGAISSYVVNMAVKLIVRRERPLEIFRWMSESSFSYPSSHTMCTTFVYGFLIYILQTSNIGKKTKWILTALSMVIIPWVAFTRIVLSVHYFSDVIGGFVFGLFILDIMIIIYEVFHAKGYNGLKNILFTNDQQ